MKLNKAIIREDFVFSIWKFSRPVNWDEIVDFTIYLLKDYKPERLYCIYVNGKNVVNEVDKSNFDFIIKRLISTKEEERTTLSFLYDLEGVFAPIRMSFSNNSDVITVTLSHPGGMPEKEEDIVKMLNDKIYRLLKEAENKTII